MRATINPSYGQHPTTPSIDATVAPAATVVGIRDELMALASRQNDELHQIEELFRAVDDVLSGDKPRDPKAQADPLKPMSLGELSLFLRMQADRRGEMLGELSRRLLGSRG